jgi:hypothetical protein
MTTFTDLTDSPDEYEGQKKKIVTVTDSEDGLEFKESSDFGAEFNRLDRSDPTDLADDDVRAIADNELREKIYRVTEKIKAILIAHDELLYGADGLGGVVGRKGDKGDPGALGPPGASTRGPTGPQGPQGDGSDVDLILTTSAGGDGWFNGEIPFEDYSVLVDFNGNVLTG